MCNVLKNKKCVIIKKKRFLSQLKLKALILQVLEKICPPFIFMLKALTFKILYLVWNFIYICGANLFHFKAFTARKIASSHLKWFVDLGERTL